MTRTALERRNDPYAVVAEEDCKAVRKGRLAGGVAGRVGWRARDGGRFGWRAGSGGGQGGGQGRWSEGGGSSE